MAMACGKSSSVGPGLNIYSCASGGLGIVVGENKSPVAMSLEIACSYSGSSNVIASRSSLETNDVLGPSEVRIINCVSQVGNGGFSRRQMLSIQSGFGMGPRAFPEISQRSVHMRLS